MEGMLGPTPLPRLPPTAVVDIYPIACFRGLDACRDAPAELLTLDDGQVSREQCWWPIRVDGGPTDRPQNTIDPTD